MLERIFEDCKLPVKNYERVGGGDISTAYCLHTNDQMYFLKTNNADSYPDMFEKEADGLSALKNACALVVPGVVKYGQVLQQQYILMEWIEQGEPGAGSWENFGAAIAAMHLKPQPWFGWKEDNYIGSLRQCNKMHDSWPSVFCSHLESLIIRLFDSGVFVRADILKAEALYGLIDSLFPAEPPALLHGDLWSGNFMMTTDGNAAIYDPAVYYGNREMDIGMSILFGGFDKRFYEAYHEVYPLEKGWRQRLPLVQLYPLLVHAILFGGHYVSRCKEILLRFARS